MKEADMRWITFIVPVGKVRRIQVVAGHNGQKAASFDALLRGDAAGTLFVRQQDRLSAKKHWLRHSLKPHGQLVIDDGAVLEDRVVVRHVSLISAVLGHTGFPPSRK